MAADWRVLDGAVTAWFDAPSLVEGAALAGSVLTLSPGSAVDLRATGVRVRLDAVDHVEAVSGAARDIGLTADPAAQQHLNVVIESTDPARVTPFWQRAFDYAPGPSDALVDPLRRDPELRFRHADQARPLRNRIHLDVVRPAAAVERADLGEPSGPYGVRHSDPDGNEVDVVPGEGLGAGQDTADWQVVFGAVACYRVSSPAQQHDVATAAATIARDAGFPLLVDLRPGLVVLDSGKDQHDPDAHGLDLDFAALAGRLQSAARGLGATSHVSLPRFAQVVIDAGDIAALRAFWSAALGYRADRRDGVTDLYDPRRLDPVLLFQDLDAADLARRRQRNRLSVELAVPADVAPVRVDTIVAAGGLVRERSAGRVLLTDPEGNELAVVAT